MTGPTRATDDDRTLLRDFALTRDDGAFAAIVARYGPMVAATARRQVRDPHRADDVAQAVFLVLARRADAIDGSLGAWLHRATLLSARNAHRVDARRLRHERDAALQRPRAEPTPIDADLLTALDAALDALPTRDREVIGLRFFESLGVGEIARRLGLNDEAAKKRLARATDRLRGAMRGRDTAAVGAAMSALAVPAEVTFTAAPTPAAQALAKGTMTTMKHALLLKAAAITLAAGTVAGGVALAANESTTPAPVLVAATPTAPPPATVPATRPVNAIESNWDALAGDEPAASIALLHLAREPNAFVAIAHERLAPLTLTTDALAALLVDLGGDDEAKSRAARERLEYLDPRLAVDLRPLVDETTEQPLRSRLIEVLSGEPAGSFAGKKVELTDTRSGGFNFLVRGPGRGNSSWWAESRVERLNVGVRRKPSWDRAVLALALLGQIDTPAARSIVEAMATGHPDAQPTRAAKSLLERPASRPSAEADWDALAKAGPASAAALLRLAARPEDAVAVCKARLAPLLLTPDELVPLLVDLGADAPAISRAARERLEYFDPRLADDLPTLMDGVAGDPVTTSRLVEVLGGYPADTLAGKKVRLRQIGGDFNFVIDEPDGASSWWAEQKVERLAAGRGDGKPQWTRAARAIALLESIGTPEARAIVDAMATGHPQALPTRVAKELVAARR